MKGETRLTGMARVIGLLVALALLLRLLLPSDDSVRAGD